MKTINIYEFIERIPLLFDSKVHSIIQTGPEKFRIPEELYPYRDPEGFPDLRILERVSLTDRSLIGELIKSYKPELLIVKEQDVYRQTNPFVYDPEHGVRLYMTRENVLRFYALFKYFTLVHSTEEEAFPGSRPRINKLRKSVKYPSLDKLSGSLKTRKQRVMKELFKEFIHNRPVKN